MTITEIHKKLTHKKVITSSRQYLSKLVGQGKIPYTEIGGVKEYSYKEVKKALLDLNQKLPNGRNFNPKQKDGSPKTINSTKIFLQEYQGMIAKQKFDIEAQKLVYREEVENKAFTVLRVLRDQILIIPERISGELSSETDVVKIKEILYKEINSVLEYLSSEKDLYE